ncbi:hypothetical protein QUF90_00090 [Desulfococcaceae bacterium HSG9]|nr:hypothetical protein [Desulfococcaceae bacterium HSG9]
MFERYKYNSIGCYQAGSKKLWNGYVLDTVKSVLNRVGDFVWKGLKTVVYMIEIFYENSVLILLLTENISSLSNENMD